jgi:hypothetical protein
VLGLERPRKDVSHVIIMSHVGASVPPASAVFGYSFSGLVGRRCGRRPSSHISRPLQRRARALAHPLSTRLIRTTACTLHRAPRRHIQLQMARPAAYGLQKKTLAKPLNIFAGGGEDDDEDEGPVDARARTNAAIAKAQAAQSKV